MRNIKVKVHKSSAKLKKENQLAWKIAEIAFDNAPLNENAVDIVINRIIDNASVAIAALQRQPVISAREMALLIQEKMVQQFLELTQIKNFIVNGQHGRMEQQLEN